MEELAEQIFGTRDYEAALEMLPPYDGAVRLFWQKAKELKEGGMQDGQKAVCV